ncbi:MAG: transposase [Thermoplasmata archaeon]
MDIHSRWPIRDTGNNQEILFQEEFQSCIVHAERNLLSKVRAGDKYIIGREMKRIFDASSEEEARKRFNEFKEEWNNKYPKAMYNLENRLDLLLTYYKYPEPVRKVIRSTNMIERLNKEIRRRIKIIDSLSGEESARKIIYLRILEENNKYSVRTIP